MKKLLLLLAVVAILFSAAPVFAADNQASVTYQVQAINVLKVSGNPALLKVDAAIAGSAPTAVQDVTTTYAITTNETGKKITGAIDSIMPTGLTLKMKLAAPVDGTSIDDVFLTATGKDLVTGISQKNESGLLITYTLSAAIDAALVTTTATRTVTLTIQ